MNPEEGVREGKGGGEGELRVYVCTLSITGRYENLVRFKNKERYTPNITVSKRHQNFRKWKIAFAHITLMLMIVTKSLAIMHTRHVRLTGWTHPQ